MMNFVLGDNVKDELIFMTRAWDKEKNICNEYKDFDAEVMGSIPVGDSDFFSTNARVMYINSSFTFIMEHKSSPSLLTSLSPLSVLSTLLYLLTPVL